MVTIHSWSGKKHTKLLHPTTYGKVFAACCFVYQKQILKYNGNLLIEAQTHWTEFL